MHVPRLELGDTRKMSRYFFIFLNSKSKKAKKVSISLKIKVCLFEFNKEAA